MKALKILKPLETAIADVPEPAMGPEDILVKINYVGFCGSDLNSFRGGNAMVTFPRVPGHEIGGTVKAVGKDVPDGTLAVGNIVTINPYTSCGSCPSCRRKRYNACEFNETLGVQRDGAMQEYISIPWRKVMKCPGISVRDAALIEPMSVGFHAVGRGRVCASDTVMVIGCGMVGLGAIAGAVSRGATVIAADLDDEKLKLATGLGAAFTYNTASEWKDIPQPDVVIEAVGSIPTYRLAVEKVAFTGRIVCIGYAKSDVPLTTSLFVKKELDVLGSRNATPEDFEAVMEYMRKHDVSGFISAVIKPDEAQTALEKWSEAPGKVFRILVDFD